MMWLVSILMPSGNWMPRFYSFYREVAERIAEEIHEQDTETKTDLVRYDPTRFKAPTP